MSRYSRADGRQRTCPTAGLAHTLTDGLAHTPTAGRAHTPSRAVRYMP